MWSLVLIPVVILGVAVFAVVTLYEMFDNEEGIDE